MAMPPPYLLRSLGAAFSGFPLKEGLPCGFPDGLCRFAGDASPPAGRLRPAAAASFVLAMFKVAAGYACCSKAL
jgi:hypothetical protein